MDSCNTNKCNVFRFRYDANIRGEYMNFLDASILVNEYIDVFANGHFDAFGTSGALIPSYVEGKFKSNMITASKIYLANELFWDKLDDEYVDQFFSLLFYINFILPPAKAEEIKRAKLIVERSANDKLYAKLNKKRIHEAGQVLTRNMPSGPDHDVIEAFNHMLVFKNTIITHNTSLDMKEKVLSMYCAEAYKTANVDFKPEYEIYFHTFNQMREWLNHPQLSKYFLPYKDHLYKYKF